MKTYKVSINCTEEITADTEEEALDMFWDNFHRALAEEELATVETV